MGLLSGLGGAATHSQRTHVLMRFPAATARYPSSSSHASPTAHPYCTVRSHSAVAGADAVEALNPSREDALGLQALDACWEQVQSNKQLMERTDQTVERIKHAGRREKIGGMLPEKWHEEGEKEERHSASVRQERARFIHFSPSPCAAEAATDFSPSTADPLAADMLHFLTREYVQLQRKFKDQASQHSRAVASFDSELAAQKQSAQAALERAQTESDSKLAHVEHLAAKKLRAAHAASSHECSFLRSLSQQQPQALQNARELLQGSIKEKAGLRDA